MELAEKASHDFSQFIVIDMQHKLEPINKSVEGMLARLEELQTMIGFARQERMNATNLMTLIVASSKDLTDLFRRIDAVEHLVEDVKNTLNSLETEIVAMEETIGYSDSTASKVANIFTPLFKKTTERKNPVGQIKPYDTSTYFH